MTKSKKIKEIDHVGIFVDLRIDQVSYEDSVKVFEDLLKDNPGHVGLLFQLANVHSVVGKNKLKAIKFHKEVIKRDPKYLSALHNLAVIHLELKKYKQAYSYANKLYKLDQSADYKLLRTKCLKRLAVK